MIEIPDRVRDLGGDDCVVEVPHQGKVSRTLKICTPLKTWTLKIATDNLSRRRLNRESAILAQVGTKPTHVYDIPRVCRFHCQEGWLLLEWIPGQRLRDRLRKTQDMSELVRWVREYAKAIRWIHNLPSSTLNASQSWLEWKLSEAKNNLVRGWVNQDDLNLENRGVPLEELFQRLLGLVPEPRISVCIHGDVASDNLIEREERIVGIIDWSEAGFGDPYADLALAWREMARKPHSDHLWNEFLKVYGLDEIDWNRIEFFLLLDEFM